MAPKNILLPAGFYDLLPSAAAKESAAAGKLLSAFEAFGYAQVAPPLMEFEASLLSGRGGELSAQTFRVVDGKSHQMMAIRPDMTLQVARIATNRLRDHRRPLRLCYAGAILQSRPEPLRTERQLTQAGIELIGSDSLQADAEIMIIAAESLTRLGIKELSIDINLPGLLPALCPEAEHDMSLQKQVKDAITCRDTATIARLPVANASLLAELVACAGTVEKSLPVLEKLGIPQAAFLKELTTIVAGNCPQVALTLDIIEYRGFDYHSGISFSLFARGLRHELGRGGRYIVEGESATGFTIYVTHLLDLLPEPETRPETCVSTSDSMETIRDLHTRGMKTLYSL